MAYFVNPLSSDSFSRLCNALFMESHNNPFLSKCLSRLCNIPHMVSFDYPSSYKKHSYLNNALDMVYFDDLGSSDFDHWSSPPKKNSSLINALSIGAF